MEELEKLKLLLNEEKIRYREIGDFGLEIAVKGQERPIAVTQDSWPSENLLKLSLNNEGRNRNGNFISGYAEGMLDAKRTAAEIVKHVKQKEGKFNEKR